MAEGIQLASFNSKYFCHHCSREVSPYHTTELICPDCSSGFLEEVSKDLYEAENLPQNCDEYEYESENDVDSDDLSFIPELSMDSLISQMLMNVAGNSHPVRPEVPLPPSLIETEELPEAEPHVEESGLFREELMNEILRPVGMQGLFSDGDIDSALGRLRYFEDYNVDDEVDALASQLLDEVEVAGPPPLSKDQIKALPTVTLSKEHIEKGLQCTVCMDDFSFKEKAKGLPCSHLYHEKCITPWLEKQSTCPNCRDVIKMQSKFKRSRSCPRTRLSSRNSDNRRFSEATSLSDFFTTSFPATVSHYRSATSSTQRSRDWTFPPPSIPLEIFHTQNPPSYTSISSGLFGHTRPFATGIPPSDHMDRTRDNNHNTTQSSGGLFNHLRPAFDNLERTPGPLTGPRNIPCFFNTTPVQSSEGLSRNTRHFAFGISHPSSPVTTRRDVNAALPTLSSRRSVGYAALDIPHLTVGHVISHKDVFCLFNGTPSTIISERLYGHTSPSTFFGISHSAPGIVTAPGSNVHLGNSTPFSQNSGGLYSNTRPTAFRRTPGTDPFVQTISPSLIGVSGGFTGIPASTETKFKPPTGTDTIIKRGILTRVTTRHQCLPCPNKSFEELRVEFHAASKKFSNNGSSSNRKRPGSPMQNTYIFVTPTGGSTTAMTGTTASFYPPTGIDFIRRGNSQMKTLSKYQCITTMEEYENKSLEELRVEDYAANRIRPEPPVHPTGYFGTSLAATTPTSVFRGTRQLNPSFGFTDHFGIGSATNLFGSNGNSFGTTSSTSTPFIGLHSFTNQDPVFRFGTSGSTGFNPETLAREFDF